VRARLAKLLPCLDEAALERVSAGLREEERKHREAMVRSFRERFNKEQEERAETLGWEEVRERHKQTLDRIENEEFIRLKGEQKFGTHTHTHVRTHACTHASTNTKHKDKRSNQATGMDSLN
jgi:hypothetical protein